MMDYIELVKKLREHNGWALNETLNEAADAIEQLRREQLHADCVMGKMGDKLSQLERRLCEWCGVCPEDKQNVWDCEIAFPELQVPEVSIEPPTYPCADCVHYPPSSTDGKPCCACDPANPLTNCHETRET